MIDLIPRSSTTAALLCSVCGFSPLAAQTGVPGGSHGGSAPRHMARYYGFMLEKVQEITGAFEQAWQDGDAETLEEIYHEDARLMIDEGFPIRGPTAITAQLREMFPQRWNVRLTIVDFEADGYMAMVYGELGDAPGKHLTVIMRKGDDWGITRQLLLGTEEQSDAAAGSNR